MISASWLFLLMYSTSIIGSSPFRPIVVHDLRGWWYWIARCFVRGRSLGILANSMAPALSSIAIISKQTTLWHTSPSVRNFASNEKFHVQSNEQTTSVIFDCQSDKSQQSNTWSIADNSAAVVLCMLVQTNINLSQTTTPVVGPLFALLVKNAKEKSLLLRVVVHCALHVAAQHWLHNILVSIRMVTSRPLRRLSLSQSM